MSTLSLLTQLTQIINTIASIVSKWNMETDAGERLYNTAVSCLGQDVAPIENEFGCAESVNNIVFKAFGDYAGGDLSTYRMYNAIKNNNKFVLVKDMRRGDIIISPTGYGNGRVKNGHVGIVSDNGKIMSNDSSDGLFKENYTLPQWRNRYQYTGGYPIYFYRRLIA